MDGGEGSFLYESSEMVLIFCCAGPFTIAFVVYLVLQYPYVATPEHHPASNGKMDMQGKLKFKTKDDGFSGDIERARGSISRCIRWNCPEYSK